MKMVLRILALLVFHIINNRELVITVFAKDWIEQSQTNKLNFIEMQELKF